MSDSIAQKLPVGWSLKLSSDYCESIADGTHDTPKPIETDGVPLYTSKNLTKFNRLDTDDVYVISKTDAVEINKRSYVGKYDILFGMIGTIGNPVVIETETNQFAVKNVCIFRFNGKKADSLWFYYNLCSEFFESQISRMLDGSTQKFVPLSTLRNFLVPTPANEEQQQKIAKILSTVDNLIEKTQSLIDKYTDIKQGMLADLFTRGIDLSNGPDGTPASNPSYGQLRPCFEDAPELYKETELGWVPKEWEVSTVGEIAEVTKLAGFEFTQYFNYAEGGEIIALRAMNIKNEKIDITNIQRISKSVSIKLPRSKLYIGDIVFTYIGAYIGDAVIIDEDDKYHLAPNICLIRPMQSKSAFFLFKQLRSEPLYRQMMSKTVTTATPSLTMTQIRTLKLSWPPINEQLEIESRLRSIDENIDILVVDLNKRKELKKGLMQDLLTGKVEVA